ncbi:LysR family transcriptional regulator [Marinicellulosiphila megalodicopiae]|uniref:LysR family transcriptional regulator n=1 Tax=Marinicellulosiphila megalodicopiae TaxID=2724896 RepID=UPI003BB1B441
MKPNIQSDHLILFTQVAQLGSLSRASLLNNIPVSTISRRLASLEGQIGYQLLTRNTKGIQVTEIGNEILRYGKSINNELESLSAFLAHKNDEPHGVLRVSMPATTSASIITDIIHSYKKLCPEVTIDLRMTDRFVDPRIEEYDIVFNYVINEPLKDSSLIAKRIVTPKTILVCSNTFEQNIQTAEDLNQVKCVSTLERNTKYITWQLQKGETNIIVSPKPSVVVNNLDAVKSAILNGYGIGRLVVTSCAEELANGELVQVLEDWDVSSWDVYLMYPSRKHLPAKTQKFIELMSFIAQDRYYE